MRFMQLVLEALNRAGIRPPRLMNFAEGTGLDRHDWSRAKQTAELDHITDSLADGRDNTDSKWSGVDNADCDLVRDQAGNNLSGGVTGTATMSIPTEHTAVIASSFSRVSAPA